MSFRPALAKILVAWFAACAVPAQAPDQALPHLAYLPGPKVPEPLPGELAALLAPGAIEGEQVEVRIEPQIGRLHRGDRAALRAEPTLLRRAG